MRWATVLACAVVAGGCGGGEARRVDDDPDRRPRRAGSASASSGRFASTCRGSCRATSRCRASRPTRSSWWTRTSAGPAEVAAVARAHPSIHFALVGASVKGQHAPNLAGLVLKEDDAAYLAGVTAGLAAGESGAAARVAWVGPEERALAAAFGRGVHAAAPGVAVLHQWSRSIPALCKEAALTGLDRSAVVVMAHGGLCAAAAASAAHEQNVPALALRDFVFPGSCGGRRRARGGERRLPQRRRHLRPARPVRSASGNLDARISPTAPQVRAQPRRTSASGGAKAG